jgi:hypothetical protein
MASCSLSRARLVCTARISRCRGRDRSPPIRRTRARIIRIAAAARLAGRRSKAVPGVFLEEAYSYSISAFTYRSKSGGLLGSLLSAKRAEIGEGAVAPLSPVLVKQLIREVGLDRVRVQQTTIDATIVAREVDKGTGLLAFRD